MREILFRGKDVETEEWIKGFYVCLNAKEHRIYSGYAETDCGDYYPDFWTVDPKTVGQFTGLLDKNGKKIIEGDIVAQNWYTSKEPLDDCFGEVVYRERLSSFAVMDVAKNWLYPLGRCHAFCWEAEVIGNIHDNPELLKGDAE